RAFLDGPVDPMGLSGWLPGLSGVSQFAPPGSDAVAFIKAQILGSPEYFARHGGGTNAGFLAALYRDVLGRAVDPTGRLMFGGQLAQGVGRLQVARTILESPEARQVLVSGFYVPYLHRMPDPVGLARWVTLLLARKDEDLIILGLTTSAEYLGNL